MWAAIMQGVMAGASSLIADAGIASQAKIAEKMAKAGALFEKYALARRAGYRNQEMAQQNWNSTDRANAFIGRQVAATGGSGFDVSTGDQRMFFDTGYRNVQAVSGNNITEQLEFFEDELNTINNILQYNFQAQVARQQRKQHTGIASFGKALFAGVGTALGKYMPSGPKDKVSDNVYTDGKTPHPTDEIINNMVTGVLKSNEFVSNSPLLSTATNPSSASKNDLVGNNYFTSTPYPKITNRGIIYDKDLF